MPVATTGIPARRSCGRTNVPPPIARLHRRSHGLFAATFCWRFRKLAQGSALGSRSIARPTKSAIHPGSNPFVSAPALLSASYARNSLMLAPANSGFSASNFASASSICCVPFGKAFANFFRNALDLEIAARLVANLIAESSAIRGRVHGNRRSRRISAPATVRNFAAPSSDFPPGQMLR